MSRPGASRRLCAPVRRGAARRALASGMKSATAAAMTRPSHSGNSRTRSAVELVGRLEGQQPHALGSASGPSARSASVTLAPRSRAAVGERVAHLAARAVRDEADRVDRLPRRAGRHEQAQPREVAVRARGQAPGLLDDRRRARPCGRGPRAPRPERPLSGPTIADAAGGERSTFARTAGCAHIADSMAGASRTGPAVREEVRRQEVVGEAAARTCASVCAVAGATSRRSHASASST